MSNIVRNTGRGMQYNIVYPCYKKQERSHVFSLTDINDFAKQG